MTVLITGGAGFIGSAVALALAARGDDVVLLDNFNDYYDVQLKRDRVEAVLKDCDFTLCEGDIRDDVILAEIFNKHKIDKVVHLAAMAGVRYSLEHPALYTDVNVTGSVKLLEHARKNNVANIVFASSSSVYGANAKTPFSEDDPVDGPISPYAATKRADELIAHVYAQTHGMKISMLRFFTVYGPWGRPDMAYFGFTEKILAGEPIDVYNHGKMTRNFTYIDDIVSGVITVLDADLDYSIMNIGGDSEETLERFISVIEENLGQKAQKNYLPMQLGDVPQTVADIGKLRALGWSPTTTIDTGLKNFTDWYKEYYNIT